MTQNNGGSVDDSLSQSLPARRVCGRGCRAEGPRRRSAAVSLVGLWIPHPVAVLAAHRSCAARAPDRGFHLGPAVAVTERDRRGEVTPPPLEHPHHDGHQLAAGRGQGVGDVPRALLVARHDPRGLQAAQPLRQQVRREPGESGAQLGEPALPGDEVSRLATGLPVQVLVGAQVFRVPAEVVLAGLAAAAVIPERMSFVGANFDVLTGLSAPLVAWAAATGRLPRWGLLAWNLAGMGLLGTIVTIAVLLLRQWAGAAASGSRTAGTTGARRDL